MANGFRRGDLVQVGPSYRGGNCYLPDGTEGIYTVLKPLAPGDYYLVKGDEREAIDMLDGYGFPNGGSADGLDDLLRVFHIMDGKPEPDHRNSVSSRLRRWDKGTDLTDDYLRVKIYKNGNGHVTFKRPDLVDQLNRIVAKHYPGALPPARE